MNKKLIVLPVLASVCVLTACSDKETVGEQYGNLTIDYTQENLHTMKFSKELNEDYDYDLKNRVSDIEELQDAINQLGTIATVYQDILFNFTIFTEENPSFILKDDKETFLQSINNQTRNSWYQNIRAALENVNEENLQERDLELMDNAFVLIDLTNTILKNSLEGEYDVEKLQTVKENLEKNYRDVVMLYLMSNGYEKKDIEEIFKGLNDGTETEFNQSFYYQFMKLKSK